MCNEIWENYTEDLFEEVTEAEALSDSIYAKWNKPGFLKAMWAQAKIVDTASKHPLRRMTKEKGDTIKFRRYRNCDQEETLVGDFVCEAADTLGTGRKVWRLLSRNLPGFANSQDGHAQKSMEKTPKPSNNGPSIQEG